MPLYPGPVAGSHGTHLASRDPGWPVSKRLGGRPAKDRREPAIRDGLAIWPPAPVPMRAWSQDGCRSPSRLEVALQRQAPSEPAALTQTSIPPSSRKQIICGSRPMPRCAVFAGLSGFSAWPGSREISMPPSDRRPAIPPFQVRFRAILTLGEQLILVSVG